MRPTGPACATCRLKSRRCDRARPACGRCVSKGIHCGGYPDKFRFCGPASRGKWKNLGAPATNPFAPSLATVFSAQEFEGNPRVSNLGSQRQAEPPIVPADSDEQDNNDNAADPIVHTTSPSGVNDLHEPNANLPSPACSSTTDTQLEIDRIVCSEEAGTLLLHYDQMICPHQIVQSNDDGMNNPYRLYVLPLAYGQIGVLYATLALSACHLGHLKNDKHLHESIAVNYRLMAITALGTTIQKGYSLNFNENERDGVFATIQLLLLHDICESGISEHGAHISGAASICSQLLLEHRLNSGHERMIFFLGNLAWLDIVRAFARPDRLCFAQELRERILALGNLKFEAVNGCPRELVLLIGEVLEAAKAHSRNGLGVKQYLDVVENSIAKLYSWNSSGCIFPDDNPLWLSVAEAFQHACILRALRVLDPMEHVGEPRIQKSVSVILDAVANIPKESPLIELMVLPLFMAGADCMPTHSRHYVLLRIAEVKARSEMSNTAPKQLLRRVWEARDQQVAFEKTNVPWMTFTHDYDLTYQHDYLIL